MLQTGKTFTSHTIVTEDMTARAVGSGKLPVLATPMLIALMENAAMQCIEEQLEAGQTTVGINIQVSHKRPTPIGQHIEATAILTDISGNKLIFNVTAHDKKELIAEGIHERYIVDSNRFMNKMQ